MKYYKLIENDIEYEITENINGDLYWFIKDKSLLGKVLHRANNKPAIINKKGGKLYFNYGKCHREDGPAQITHYGLERYYLNGKLYPRVKHVQELNEMIIKEIIQ